MAERILIVKIKRTSATRAELYAARHQYADLQLFDLTELAQVGIDPTSLVIGEETPARFWAIYQLSEKLNKSGRPYKDVVALEAMSAPATTTSTAVGDPEVLRELRAIRALLGALLEGQGNVSAPPPAEENGHTELDVAFPRYLDGAPLGDNPAELEAYNRYLDAVGEGPADLLHLRSWILAQRKTH
jgi:hypothetical protein